MSLFWGSLEQQWEHCGGETLFRHWILVWGELRTNDTLGI
jgi:hypothetical protein